MGALGVKDDKIMRHAALLALACLIPSASLAQPNTAFQPELLFSADDTALCADFTERVRSDFFAGHPDSANLTDKFLPASRYTHLLGSRTERTPYQVSGRTVLFKGDVDGNGQRDALMATLFGGGRAHGYRSRVVFTRLQAIDYQVALDQARQGTDRRVGERMADFISMATILGVATNSDAGLPEAAINPYENIYPENISRIAEMALEFQAPLQVIEYDQRLYVDQRVISPLHPTANSVRTLVSFNEHMYSKLDCVVSAMPHRPEHSAPLFERPPASDLLDMVKRIEGQPGTSNASDRSCQTGSFDFWANKPGSRARIIRKALFRPWSIAPPVRASFAPSREKLRGGAGSQHWLRIWRLLSAINGVDYDTLQRLTAETAPLLQSYYADTFNVGTDIADEWTVNALAEIQAAAALGAPRYYAKLSQVLDRVETGSANPEDFLTLALLPRDLGRDNPLDALPSADPGTAFRLAAAAGASDIVLDALLERGTTLDSGNESALMMSVRDPNMVQRLLARGADPNRPNVFGKTPLMMAAHVGAWDSTALLLQHGADLNRRTLGPNEFLPSDSEQVRSANICDYDIQYGHRTALMYAAENADSDHIKYLIDAGADITAEDSEGRNVANYLERNESLSGAEKDQILSWLEPK